MDFCGFLPHYMWNIILDFDGRFWCTDAFSLTAEDFPLLLVDYSILL